MSKASEWAKFIATLKAAPSLSVGSLMDPVCRVTEKGECAFMPVNLSPKRALQVAAWIVHTFGEGDQAESREQLS